MRTLRIFISSPGDVGKERVLTAHVLERLQGEYTRRAELSPYFWEHEPMRGSTDYQGNIPPPSGFDIVICILWSRLGSRLNENYRRADGSPYSSGTEYEFEASIESKKLSGKPEILVYRNRQSPTIPIEPAAVRDEKVRQYEALQNFLQRWFLNTDGTVRIASNDYHDLAEFEEKLERHLRKIIEEQAPPAPAPTGAPVRFGAYSKGSPFRRLRPFEFDDAEVFFGRTKAIDDVLTAMQDQAAARSAFTLIFGSSGSGKSSLARAGVLPMLVRPGVIEGIGLWRWAVILPSRAPVDIFAGLAGALMSNTALPEIAANGVSVDELAKSLREAPAGVQLLIKTALVQAGREVQIKEQLTAPPASRLLLLVDQLEELFTMAERFPAETRKRFVAALAEMARNGAVWILATLRSEFFGRCEEIPELVALKGTKGQYQLMPPTQGELSQIVRLPAIAAGLEFEVDPATGASLDDVLLDAAGRDGGALPLLEFTLDELYGRRRDDRFLTHSAFRELRGIEGALETAAEDVFETLPPEVAAQFDVVFRGLVTVELGEKEAFVRRIADIETLASLPERKRLIHAFVEHWLLVTDTDEQKRPVVQVCHEAFFQYWPRLRKMLDDNREFLRRRARAGGAFSLWKEQEGDRSYLWAHGKVLSEARALLERSDELTPREREFARASVNEGEAARLRRWLAIAVAVLIACGAGTSVYLWWQKSKEETEVRNLHTQLARVLATPKREPHEVSELSRRILKLAPAESDTWSVYANALLDQGDYPTFDKALQEWQQKVPVLPAKIDELRGDEESRLGHKQEAAKYWSAYLQHPELNIDTRREAWKKLADTYAELGQWIQARDRLTEWINAEDNVPGRVRRAKAYQQLRDWDAAKRDIDRARELDPSNPEVKNFGPITAGFDIETLNKRVQESPRDPAAWLARAKALTRSRQFEAALEDTEHALEKLDPDSVRLAIDKAHLLWQLNRPIPEELGVVVSEQWIHEEAKFLAAFEATQATLDALGVLDARIKEQPDEAGFYLKRGDLLDSMGQHELAVRDFSRALELNPNSVKALEQRASDYRALNQLGAAEADLRRAKELQSEESPNP